MNFVTREQVTAALAELSTWLGTPWHHEARVKGVGVDCVNLPIAVYSHVLGVKPPTIPHYPPDWHFHQEHELLLEVLERYAIEVTGPPIPGDLVVFKVFSKTYNHCAVVVDWPTICHALLGRTVTYDDVNRCLNLHSLPKRLYRLRGDLCSGG